MPNSRPRWEAVEGLFCDFISSFALAEQVDLAEKAFHDALVRRNSAQMAYLREPSIMTREALEAAKTAEAGAREILNAEIRWLASTRATTVIGLPCHSSRWKGLSQPFGLSFRKRKRPGNGAFS